MTGMAPEAAAVLSTRRMMGYRWCGSCQGWYWRDHFVVLTSKPAAPIVQAR